MDLSGGERRQIIEEILDITIFSKMNDILKTKLTDLGLDIKEKEYQKEVHTTKINGQKSLIETLQKKNEQSADKIKKEIQRVEGEKKILVDENDGLQNKIDSIAAPNVNKVVDEKQKCV
jgi:hypothetical protein